MEDWGAVKARLEFLLGEVVTITGTDESSLTQEEQDDIRAALERDEQYELLRAAVNDSGNCTDDEHGDKCACNADVMLRNLRQRVEEQGKVIASLGTEAGRTAFALSIGWPLPEEVLALRQRVEELEREKVVEIGFTDSYIKRLHTAEKRVEELEREGGGMDRKRARLNAAVREAVQKRLLAEQVDAEAKLARIEAQVAAHLAGSAEYAPVLKIIKGEVNGHSPDGDTGPL